MAYENIKLLRENAALTQQDLSNILSIPLATYRSYETGKREPNIEILTKLADYYKVTVDFILDYRVNPANNISIEESNMIKKYRVLDTHGIKMVDYVLNEEYTRCESARKTTQSETIIPTVIAAQGGGINTEISQENENAVLNKLEELDKNERKNDIGL